MSDSQRVYSDEEFALVLRKAAELANQSQLRGASSTGLTLSEMKAAAAQAGFDPALVERAARMLTDTGDASLLERLIGGPLRQTHEARFPVTFDEASAARLLSAVRIVGGLAGHQDVGHSSPLGVTWHDGGATEPLSVNARAEEGNVEVSVVLDRRGTLGMVALVSGITLLMLTLFATFGLYPQAPALGIGGFIVGVGGVLTIARRYWAASTRRARERIGVIVDVVDKSLNRPEAKP